MGSPSSPPSKSVAELIPLSMKSVSFMDYMDQKDEIDNLINDRKSRIRMPDTTDIVFNEECVYTFDNKETQPFGIFISLFTFDAIGELMIDFYELQYGPSVFLNVRQTRIVNDLKGDAENKPQKLALNVEGGFQDNAKVEIVTQYYLYFHPERIFVPIEHGDPYPLQHIVESVLTRGSYFERELQNVDPTSAFTLEDARPVSRFAQSLEQIPTTKTIGPSGWKCEQCDNMDNLWLNLSDGSVLCGRQNFGGTGANNHALHHYEQTGYPLVVKLGTITDSSADVYSYKEDMMVIDPLLEQHLLHFGIKITSLTKSAKTMNELEVEVNNTAVIGANESVGVISGPGLTGMHNLGATCYMNAVLELVSDILALIGQ
ncbi:hypothetical protein ACOME3_001839 [Neoechinorhynchus agilis]